MGIFDLYCTKSGLPMRKLHDAHNDIPEELQFILGKGVFVLDGKKTYVRNYDFYGNFEDDYNNIVNVAKYIYDNNYKTELYHEGIDKYPDMISNKNIVQTMFHGQFFDDDGYIEFYKMLKL